MKKVNILQDIHESEVSSVVLEDFTLFETKMTRIKALKEMRQYIDKSIIRTAIDALELKDKKVTAKKVKKICQKAVTQMIEEEKI